MTAPELPRPEPMPPTMKFTRETSHLVAGFTCTKACEPEPPWEADIREWILARPTEGGAIDAVELREDSVWLYLDAGRVLGYVSLGVGPRLPGSADRAQTLPCMGLHTQGRGQRLGPRIFEWVIEEARRRHREEGAPGELVLEVDPNNERAKALYLERGFVQIGVDEADPREWLIMPLRLT